MTHDDLIRQIVLAFPDASAPPTGGAVRYTANMLAYDRLGNDYEQAYAYLLERVKLWAASPECKKQEKKYRKCLAKWMRDGDWDGEIETLRTLWGYGKVEVARKFTTGALARIKEDEAKRRSAI